MRAAWTRKEREGDLNSVVFCKKHARGADAFIFQPKKKTHTHTLTAAPSFFLSFGPLEEHNIKNTLIKPRGKLKALLL